MVHDYNLIWTLCLIAGSATFMRASMQPNATALGRLCDGAALLCLALLLALSARLALGLAP